MQLSTTPSRVSSRFRLGTKFEQRRADDHEQGYILVMVLVLCLVILSLVGVALNTSVNSASVTSTYDNNIQARLASESGLNAASAAMSSVTSAASLPCSTSSTSGNWSYSTTITYANSSGITLTCPPSAWPASAVLTSTGSATKGGTVKMVQNMVITAPSTPVTTLSPALNYAVMTPGGMNMSVGATVANGLSGQQADVSVGNGINCTNTNSIAGNLYSYGTGALSFSSGCSIGKGLYANGAIALTNSVNIGGSVTSFGTGGIDLTSTPSIGGNMTSTQGSITMSNSPTIKGNAYAYGTISYNRQVVTAGSAGVNSYIQGLVSFPNNTFASSVITPSQPTFPTITDPTQAQWAASGYTNYIVVGASGTTVNGTPLTVTNNYGQTSAYTCSTFFTAQYNINGVSSSPSEFAAILNTATTPTVIDASACSNPNVSSPSGSQTYSLQTDVALLVNGVTLNTTNTFQSSSGTTHNFSLIVPSPATGGITFTNTTTFASTLSTFIYTSGQFSANSTPSINGQVLAGSASAGSVTTTNSFSLTFSNAAAQTIPGTTTTTNQSTGTPTLAAVRRYVSR
jgi:hypothetical protein